QRSAKAIVNGRGSGHGGCGQRWTPAMVAGRSCAVSRGRIREQGAECGRPAWRYHRPIDRRTGEERSMEQTAHHLPSADEAYWAAVVSRDPSADGRCYYAVRTTGVYCRPSCPSRTARREHVAFYASRADAERDGFRPCKRCRPDQPSLTERYAEKMAGICRLIDAADDIPNLDTLAQAAQMSR